MELGSVTYWTHNPETAYIHPASLDLSQDWDRHMWICKPNRRVTHTTHPPRNIIKFSLLADYTPLNKTECHRHWTISPLSVGAEQNAESTSENGGPAKSKHWEWGQGKKPTSQTRGAVDCCAYLLGLWVVHKTKLLNLVGGRADQLELQQWNDSVSA
jgi:hypothetical protein